MCHTSRKILIFCVLAIFVHIVGCQSAYAERVYLDITASDVRKVVVAVPYLRMPSAQETGTKGKDMAALLASGLELHGFIQILDNQKYGGIQDADWNALGVDYVVLSTYSQEGEKVLVEGNLFDVTENRVLSGRRYRGSAQQVEDMVLRLCDGLIEEFTGEPGISRTSIAYISDASGSKEVYISDILGRSQRQVTQHRHLCVSPRFSPDGRFLAYSTYHRGNQDLYITDLSQSKITNALSRRNGLNLGPAFAPDGKTMVVTLSKDGSPDLYLMDRQGKIIERLTARSGINVSPSFSPDGREIVFVSDRSGKPQLYIMDMKTRKTRRLTFEGSENSEPSWSPDGKQIAYTSLRGGQYQIFALNVEGGKSSQLTSGWGEFEAPSWSPDSKQIVFARGRNGQSELCIVGKNGKGLRVLFALKGNQSYPQWSSRPQ